MSLFCKKILWLQTNKGKAPPRSWLLMCLGKSITCGNVYVKHSANFPDFFETQCWQPWLIFAEAEGFWHRNSKSVYSREKCTGLLTNVKLLVYKTLCRLHLVYAASAWNLSGRKDISDIERLKDQAIRLIVGLKGRDGVEDSKSRLGLILQRKRKTNQRGCFKNTSY